VSALFHDSGGKHLNVNMLFHDSGGKELNVSALFRDSGGKTPRYETELHVKADNCTAICEPIVKKMWEPRRLNLMGLHNLLQG
jgi:hypothetical protein